LSISQSIDYKENRVRRLRRETKLKIIAKNKRLVRQILI